MPPKDKKKEEKKRKVNWGKIRTKDELYALYLCSKSYPQFNLCIRRADAIINT